MTYVTTQVTGKSGYKFWKLYSLKPGVDEKEFLRNNPRFLKTGQKPGQSEIEGWLFDSVCEATDGCTVEHDGICPHGHPSWLLVLGLI